MGQLFSYHVFNFSFRWDFIPANEFMENVPFAKRSDSKNFIELLSDSWVPFSVKENDQIAFYNDALFFYDSVRNSVFGNLKKASKDTYSNPKEEFIVKNFIYKIDPKKSLSYSIVTNKYFRFDLDLENIRLNIYTSGIAILSFYIANNKYASREDILQINDLGRRLFPRFLTVSKDNRVSLLKDPQKFGSLPIRLIISEKDAHSDIVSETFTDFENINEVIKLMPNYLPNGSQRFLVSLLGPNFTLLTYRKLKFNQIVVRPSLDDRMFAVCWYGNNLESRKLKWNNRQQQYGFQDYYKSEYWMRYLFMESGSSSAQSRILRNKLANQYTYDRWADYGTFYGVTQSTFVCLSDESEYAETNIARHMHRLYAEMVQLVLAQHTGALRYSDEISIIRKHSKRYLLKSGIVPELYKQYLEFSNHIYFKMVTPTEQGHELYQRLQNALEIESNISKVDKEVTSFRELVKQLEEEERAKINDWFSFLATLFLPASLVAAFFGVSTADKLEFTGDKFHPQFWISVGYCLLFSVLFAAIQWIKRRKLKNKDNLNI